MHPILEVSWMANAFLESAEWQMIALRKDLALDWKALQTWKKQGQQTRLGSFQDHLPRRRQDDCLPSVHGSFAKRSTDVINL
jgi:hypothetical protein